MIYVRHTYKEPISGKWVTRDEGDDRPTCDTCTCVASHQFDGAQFLCATCAADYDEEEGLAPVVRISPTQVAA